MGNFPSFFIDFNNKTKDFRKDFTIGILCMVVNRTETTFSSPNMTVDPADQDGLCFSLFFEIPECPSKRIFAFNS